MNTGLTATRPAPEPGAKTTVAPTPTEVLLGHSNETAIFADNSSELIEVRILPIKSYPALLAAQGDECTVIEMYCGKEKGWAETLTRESHEHLLSVGERLNADFFSRWVSRRLQSQERLIPGSVRRVTERALEASASPTGSPKQP
jgi:hypothetical protein